MMARWASFARHGDPNIAALPGSVAWPAVAGASEAGRTAMRRLRFSTAGADGAPTALVDDDEEGMQIGRCAFWEALYPLPATNTLRQVGAWSWASVGNRSGVGPGRSWRGPKSGGAGGMEVPRTSLICILAPRDGTGSNFAGSTCQPGPVNTFSSLAADVPVEEHARPAPTARLRRAAEAAPCSSRAYGAKEAIRSRTQAGAVVKAPISAEAGPTARRDARVGSSATEVGEVRPHLAHSPRRAGALHAPATYAAPGGVARQHSAQRPLSRLQLHVPTPRVRDGAAVGPIAPVGQATRGDLHLWPNFTGYGKTWLAAREITSE